MERIFLFYFFYMTELRFECKASACKAGALTVWVTPPAENDFQKSKQYGKRTKLEGLDFIT
jgi:hypothetical protein